jgi:hypothetical protein
MRKAAAIPAILIVLGISWQAMGFSLLDGSGNPLVVQSGQGIDDISNLYARWAEDLGNGPLWNDFGDYRTLNLSFAVEGNLLGNVNNANAAFRGFNTWSGANHQLSLTWAGYEPVLSSTDVFAIQLEGPAGTGWGANIDVFSRSPGFSYKNGFGVLQSNIFGTVGQNPGVIATSVLNIANGSTRDILTVDIFLNNGYTWRTDGTHDIPNKIYDVETVVLHEIGHALGLGHTNQGTNFQSNTQAVCVCWQTSWVMHSFYNAIKWELTNDELGGLAFHFPPRLGNVYEQTGNHDLNVFDVELGVQIIAGEATYTPEQFQAFDIDGDNALTGSDLAMLYDAVFNGGALAAGNQATPGQILEAAAYVSAQGYDPATLGLALSVPADMDGDGDVDGLDFSVFASCYNGAGKPPRSGCSAEQLNALDFDADTDVDGADFISFAACFNGAGKPPRLIGCPTD